MSGNEVKIKITADERDANATFHGTASELHDVETAADKAGNKLRESGGKAAGLKADLARLDDSLLKSKQSLSLLTSALANTDDAAQRIDIKKAISKLQSDMRASASAKKLKLTELMDLNPADVEKKATEALAPLGPTIAAVVAGAAPEIGSLVAAAVIGTSGLAGIAGGVALAARSPAVKKAGGDLGKSIMGDLTERSSVFIKPTLSAIDKLKAGFGGMGKDISRAFAATSQEVGPLTDHLVKAGQFMVHGWADAAARSGPVLDAIGMLVEHAGQNIGDMFSTLSKDSDGAVMALHDLDQVLGFVLVSFTASMDGLAKFREGLGWLEKQVYKAQYWMMDHGAKMDLVRNGYKEGTREAEAFRHKVLGVATAEDLAILAAQGDKEATGQLAKSLSNAAKAANGQREALSDLSNELKAQSDPVYALMDATIKIKKAQDQYAAAVKKGGKGSADAQKALQNMTEASIEAEGAAGKLGGTFNGQLTPELYATLRAAGLTDKQIAGVARQFRGAKRTADDFAQRYAATAAVVGVPGAIRQVRSLKQELASMRTNWDVTIRTHFLQFGKPYSDAGIRSGNVGGLASGGIKGASSGPMTSGLTWVGEHGPELAQLPPGTRVWSNPDSQRMAQGGQSRPWVIYPDFDPALEQSIIAALFRAFRFRIGNEGGNVQQSLGVTYR